MTRMRWSLIGLALVVATCSAAPVSAYAASNCTKAQAALADKQLWLSPADKQASIDQNLPWGAPRYASPPADERILVQRDYVIDYDDGLRVPVWTAHRIVYAKLTKGRTDCFRKDVRLPDALASTPADYAEPIFDQGHMTPNGDETVNETAVLNSFVMSNMTPQFCQFNRGVWQILETLVRRWAKEHGTVYVVSGSVFDRDGDGARDADTAAIRMKSDNGGRRVAIPSGFYKIIAFQGRDHRVPTLTVLLPHDQTDLDGQAALDYLGRHVVKLVDVERLTGLSFFGQDEASLDEAGSLWPPDGAPPKSLANISWQCRKTAGARIGP